MTAGQLWGKYAVDLHQSTFNQATAGWEWECSVTYRRTSKLLDRKVTHVSAHLSAVQVALHRWAAVWSSKNNHDRAKWPKAGCKKKMIVRTSFKSNLFTPLQIWVSVKSKTLLVHSFIHLNDSNFIRNEAAHHWSRSQCTTEEWDH